MGVSSCRDSLSKQWYLIDWLPGGFVSCWNQGSEIRRILENQPVAVSTPKTTEKNSNIGLQNDLWEPRKK